jgi:hypothetical protein
MKPEIFRSVEKFFKRMPVAKKELKKITSYNGIDGLARLVWKERPEWDIYTGAEGCFQTGGICFTYLKKSDFGTFEHYHKLKKFHESQKNDTEVSFSELLRLDGTIECGEKNRLLDS